MKLKKEDVYIDLRGKSKKELTELWEFLKDNNQETYNTKIKSFLYDFYHKDTYNLGIEFHANQWIGSLNDDMKIGVTIEQLKEIIKPDLQTQLENAKKEVEMIESLIMEENKPKAGDWCTFWDNDKSNLCISKLWYICHNTAEYKYHSPESHYKNCEKIINAELIKLLEYESK